MGLSHRSTCSSGCTCTGGPYKHGPEGRDEVLNDNKNKKAEVPPKTQEER